MILFTSHFRRLPSGRGQRQRAAVSQRRVTVRPFEPRAHGAQRAMRLIRQYAALGPLRSVPGSAIREKSCLDPKIAWRTAADRRGGARRVRAEGGAGATAPGPQKRRGIGAEAAEQQSRPAGDPSNRESGASDPTAAKRGEKCGEKALRLEGLPEAGEGHHDGEDLDAAAGHPHHEAEHAHLADIRGHGWVGVGKGG